MKHIDVRKTLSAAVLSGGPMAATSALAQSQSSYGMMGGHGNGWMGGGYGGFLLPVLLVVVVAGVVAWIVVKKRKRNCGAQPMGRL